MLFKRTESYFLSKGTRCSGWLYIPDGIKNPPVIIMAHGFGAEKTFRLDAFAERFADSGFAVFLFDYRNFGDSEGEPRNLINPFRHLVDWKNAIAHVRKINYIDNKRIFLWGTSFSGGHVIVTAANDGEISGIIAQVPFTDGFAVVRFLGFKFLLQATVEGLKDLLRMITFRPPYYAPIVGAPGSFAFLNTPGCREGYLAMVQENTNWKNECPARVAFPTLFYRPIKYARKVKCPALIICAEKDELIPVLSVKKTAKKMSRAKLVSLPVGHFDVYFGDVFEQVVKREIDFIKHITG